MGVTSCSPRPDGRQIGLQQIRWDLGADSDADKNPARVEKRARSQCRHLAIPHVQQPVLSQADPHLSDREGYTGGHRRGAGTTAVARATPADPRSTTSPSPAANPGDDLLCQTGTSPLASPPRSHSRWYCPAVRAQAAGHTPHQLLVNALSKGLQQASSLNACNTRASRSVADVQRMEGVGLCTQRVEPFLRPRLT